MRMNRRIILAAALAVTLAGAAAGVAHAVTTTKSGTTVGRVSIVTQDAAQSYSSESWTTVGSTTIVSTAGAHILVQFTAECTVSGTAGGWASVRILVNSVEADPAVGIDFAFDHVESTSAWESHGLQRVRTVPSQGVNTVSVQIAVSNTGITARLDDWTLTAWAINAGLPA